MSTTRITVYCLRSVVPLATRDGTQVVLELEMTPAQRFAAVEQLLGVGIGEQAAYEGIRAMFPSWFLDDQAQPAPEVRDSTWGEFNAAKEAA